MLHLPRRKLSPSLALCLGLPLLLQGVDQTFSQIEDALRRGEASRLSSYMAPQVEIFLRNTARVYSNTQARYILQEFFQENPPRTFTLLHKGRSDEMVYAIGSYVSVNGRWDVSLFTRFQGGRYLIQQIRFEPVEN